MEFVIGIVAVIVGIAAGFGIARVVGSTKAKNAAQEAASLKRNAEEEANRMLKDAESQMDTLRRQAETKPRMRRSSISSR